MKNSFIIYVIPAHGWSTQLKHCVAQIENELKAIGVKYHGIVSNSATEFCVSDLPSECISLLSCSADDYWTGAVYKLIARAQEMKPDFIYLCNHDTILKEGALKVLFEHASEHSQCVVSRCFSLGDPDKPEATSFSTHWLRGFMADDPLKHVVSSRLPWQVEAVNGRSVLLPCKSVKLEYFPLKTCPHYYGDTVLTSRIQRGEGAIWVHPESHVLVDNSDIEKKRHVTSPASFTDLKRVFFDPRSQRFLKASFFGPFFAHNNQFFGFVAGFNMVCGRIFLSLLEAAGLKKRL